MRISPIRRALATTLLLVFLLDLIAPTAAYALTGGPSQPEFESFEPVSTDQMVDLFTGDFNYNIPLMTVPGPNGGYPINLAYHAGIGMEQEASWVGLGWNINAGVVNRVLRGLPDDFNGDEVQKETKMRPNNTIAINGQKFNMEIFGFQPGASATGTVLSGKAGLYYNNYRGVGLRASASLPLQQDQLKKKMDQGGMTGALSVGFDSQKGLEIVPSISHHAVSEKLRFNTTLSMSLSSNYGVQSVDMANGFDRLYRAFGPRPSAKEFNNVEKEKDIPGTTGISFSSPSFVPASATPTTGRNFTLGMVYSTLQSPAFTPSKPVFTLETALSSVYIPKSAENRWVKSYGYLYSDSQGSLGDGLMDFNRDKDHPVTRRIPNAPMPVFTYDAYIIKGQGTGGSFRPFRSDIGILTEEETNDRSHGVEATAELGFEEAPAVPPAFKLGADLGYTYGSSYAGSWKSGDKAITTNLASTIFNNPLNNADIRFQAGTPSKPLYEPFYFKAAGERTASAMGQWSHIGGARPVRFELRETFSNNDDGVPMMNREPIVRNRILNAAPHSIPREKTTRTEREKRVQNVEYRTKAQITSDPGYDTRPLIIFPANQVPTNTSNAQQFNYAPAHAKDHHIGEMSVLEPNGSRYIYGLPVYNTAQKEAVFAMEYAAQLGGQGAINENSDAPIADWPPTSDIGTWVDQGNSQDRYYSVTHLPPYAHSYLLTAVVSHDYVDLTGNGPSTDDLGYYTKFNYTPAQPELWRSPFSGVHFSPGHLSNDKDNKGSYTYGEKNIHYLHSIETKTHFALFVTAQNRTDARGASSESNLGGPSATAQRRLERIELYSRENVQQPLKSVVFTYATGANSLCLNPQNSSASNAGKLTLESVHFLYMGSLKGSLSRYQFTYGAINDADVNPGYSPYAADRWGNYRKEDGTWKRGHRFVDQAIEYDEQRHDHASAWCLREIQLPSGGRIKVEYESDDYAHVQNEDAMQMFKVVGTSKESATTYDLVLGDSKGEINKEHTRIYIDLGRKYQNVQATMAAMTAGVEDLYFKTWQRLKRRPIGDEGAPWVDDYVEGWAKIDFSKEMGICSTNDRIAYFSVKQQEYGLGYKAHPFRKAGWQYLRSERPDLLFPPNDGLNSSIGAASTIASINLMLSSVRMLVGYYNMAAIQGWCKRMWFPDDRPSFVRLKTPVGRDYRNDNNDVLTLAGKFGGGHRVRSITVTDSWSEGSNTYGKTYDYTRTLADGRKVSSGVAEYEPLLDGEEIALRKPVWYNGSDARVSFRNNDAYLEEPFGEALYPGASVGYGQVTVRDIVPDGVSLSGNGTTVHEFYTAKDFPVRTEHTDLDYTHFSPPPIPLPFIGSVIFNNHGYSQGYAVHLNDMHGKPKAVASYPQCADPTGEPKTRTFYRYNTEAGHPDRLSNEAQVLSDHFDVETAALGTTTEFYTDLREHSSKSIQVKANVNVTIKPYPPPALPLVIPSYIPGFNYSKSIFRSVVTTKVVHRLGILGEVVNEVDGARATTQTLLYDAYTGEPLLSVVNNEHEKPVYTYKYAAHMAYEGMSGAYKNWGALVELSGTGNGNYELTGVNGPDEVFQIGDEVISTTGGDRAWVSNVLPNIVSLRDADNQPANGFTYVRIMRSGRRNLQSVQNGTIVSLVNPVTGTMPDVLYQYNAQVHGDQSWTIDNCCMETDMSYTKCGTGTDQGAEMLVRMGPNTSVLDGSTLTWGGLAIVFDIAQTSDCKPLLLIPNPDPSTYTDAQLLANVFKFDDMYMVGMTGEVITLAEFGEVEGVTISYGQGQETITAYWWDPEDCHPKCMNILHADATEYADAWTYDYADVGNPTSANGVLSTSTVNPHRYGQAGVWRPVRNHLYQVDRKNTESQFTHINTDGEYQRFTRFDFADPGNNPENRWVRREEMTRYSPYGFALESKDANEIPSSMLFGYGNSKAVAKAANAGYYEVAFDGFEDHGSAYSSGHGHLALSSTSGSVSLSDVQAHSGGKCAATIAGQQFTISTTVGNSVLSNWVPEPQQRYTVSAWVRANNSTYVPFVQVLGNGSPIPVTLDETDAGAIEGWKKVTATFTAPAGGTPLEVRIGANGASAGQLLIDDVRIHPADASMASYVYDPKWHWLLAELDDRNYATFYNYDEEGTLVQVKKETERGVMTLRTTRRNTMQ